MTVDKTAVITGSGSRRGIGRATAVRMAEQGWAIAVVDRDRAGAIEAARAIHARGGTALPVVADLTDEASVSAAERAIRHELPPVGAVINNAGVTDPTRFSSTTLAAWKELFAANVESQFLVTRAFLPGLVDRGTGRVVAVASAAGQRGGGYFGGVHYSASKAALLGMMKSLAREYAGTGVTFNSVSPGAIDTDITAGAMSKQRRIEIEAATPIGRLGRSNEVAAVIAFLCCDEAAFITGATYDVNGGTHIH